MVATQLGHRPPSSRRRCPRWVHTTSDDVYSWTTGAPELVGNFRTIAVSPSRFVGINLTIRISVVDDQVTQVGELGSTPGSAPAAIVLGDSLGELSGSEARDVRDDGNDLAVTFEDSTIQPATLSPLEWRGAATSVEPTPIRTASG
ncbi:MAG: hypothetical protein ACI9OJ_000983 [Myxococcota bacterium]|jgi:hypothetical protein